jgi:HEAT repeats/Putative zinc-finger
MSLHCDAARDQFALLLYGELSFDEEELVETHLDGCAECRAALDRQRSLHAAFDSVAVEPPASLLRECRAELGAALELEARPAPQESWWDHFVGMLTGASVLRPAGAMALLALGFFAARFTPLLSQPFGGGLSEAGVARVRDVQTAPDGKVRIVVDETRQRTISGGLDDQKIQSLLLEAVRDPNDPGLRSDSVELLKNTQSADVRDALIYELQNDENTGVRLRALAGLKSFVHQPEVREALIQTLLNAPNAGVRSEAIKVLVESAGENPDSQVIGALQQLMLREKDAGLRQQSQRVLASFNASAEIY